MIVLGDVVDQAGADAQDLLLTVRDAPAVDLGLGELLEVIAVDPDARPIWQHLVGAREVHMEGLSRLGVVGSKWLVRVVVLGVPQVVQSPGGGLFGR